MDHVVTQPAAPFLVANGALEVHQVPAWRDNLVWILRCTATGETAVVDGPDDTAVSAYGLPVNAILNTHTHPDHVGLNRAMARKGTLAGVRVWGAAARAADIPGLTDPLSDGDPVRVGAVTGQALLTEGHIDGHLSYVFQGAVFCGDALFTGGCGYLFDGPPAKMHASLQRLMALDPTTRVCCAHEYTADNLRFAWFVEPDNAALAERIRAVWAVRAVGGSAVPSTIAVERATNPFVRDSATIRAAVARHLPSMPTDTPAALFAAVRALKDRKLHPRDDAGLPL